MLLAGILVLVAWAAFGNARHGAFVLDDHCIDGRLPLSSRPLFWLSMALHGPIAGHSSVPYHVVNVCLHIASALLLFGVVRRTPIQGLLREDQTLIAFCISCLWVTHPLQTESVTYVWQRSEELMGMFYLGALYAFARSWQSPRAVWWRVGAILCALLSLASKEVAATVPIVLLLYDYVFMADSWRGVLRARWTFHATLLGAWLGLFFLLVGWQLFAENATAGFSMPGIRPREYALTQLEVVPYYIRLALWPHPLCLDYGWPLAVSVDQVVPGACLMLAVVVLTGWGIVRRSWLGLAGAFFLIVLAPTSSLMPIQDPAAEHRMYLPLAALIAVAVGLACRLGSRSVAGKRALWMLFGAAVVCLIGATRSRNEDYASAVRLWRTVVECRPLNARAHCNLGVVLKGEGKLKEAANCFLAALALRETYPLASINLGESLFLMGRNDDARKAFRVALEVEQSSVAHWGLGNTFLKEERFGEAIEEYSKSLQLDDNNEKAHLNMGVALVSTGRFEEAARHYQRALQVPPNVAEEYCNLGRALLKCARADEALKQYLHAAFLKPTLPQAISGIAESLRGASAGGAERTQAVEAVTRAAKLTGYGEPEILAALSICQESVSDFGSARSTLLTAIDAAAKAGRQGLLSELRARLSEIDGRAPR